MNRRTSLTLVVVGLLAGCLATLAVQALVRGLRGRASADPTEAAASDVAAVIDADVPGTEAFFRGQSLGVTPVRLTRDRFRELGLKAPDPGPDGEIGFDGWGEGLFFGDEDETETKVMLRVPDAHADEFLTVDTPWGRRTKLGGLSDGGSYGRTPVARVRLMPTVPSDGLRLRLAMPARVVPDAGVVKVSISCANTGAASVAGRKPEVELFWGTFDTPWRRRACKRVELPVAWARLAPGQSVSAEAEIPAPPVAGDYSVFAVFNLYATDERKTLVGQGSQYSDSHLLRVR